MGTWGFPGCSLSAHSCSLSASSPCFSCPSFSLTHRNRDMNTNSRPGGDPLWKGCWELSGPPLLCPEEGLQLREESVLSRGHTPHLGQSLELSLALSIPHPRVQSPGPSCPLLPTTEPFSQPP